MLRNKRIPEKEGKKSGIPYRAPSCASASEFSADVCRKIYGGHPRTRRGVMITEFFDTMARSGPVEHAGEDNRSGRRSAVVLVSKAPFAKQIGISFRTSFRQSSGRNLVPFWGAKNGNT